MSQDLSGQNKQYRLAIDTLIMAYQNKKAAELYDAIEAARAAGEGVVRYEQQLLTLDDSIRYNRADNASDEDAILSLIKQYIAQYSAQKGQETRLVMQYQEALKTPQTAFKALQEKLEAKKAFAVAEVICSQALDDSYMPDALRPEQYQSSKANSLVQLKANYVQGNDSPIDLIKVSGISFNLKDLVDTINHEKGPFAALLLHKEGKAYKLRAELDGNRVKFQKVPADNPSAKPTYISLAESQSGWNKQVANVFAQLAQDMNKYNVFTAGFERQNQSATETSGMEMDAQAPAAKRMKMKAD